MVDIIYLDCRNCTNRPTGRYVDEFCSTFDLATSIPPDLVTKAISGDRLHLAESNLKADEAYYDTCLKQIDSSITKNKR